MTKVRFQYKQAGFCYSHENLARRDGKRRDIRFPATYAILEHPTKGLILFDTGYSQRFFEDTARFPASIYARLTPVTLPEGELAMEAVQQMGHSPESVQHIIISHFHADHIGGLKDFPNATFYCSSAAWNQVKGAKGINALRKAILPGHLPEDMAKRIQVIDQGFCREETDPHLGTLWDLWGDGSIKLAWLPGHAAGQIGAIFQCQLGEVFLIADAAWLIDTVQDNILPSRVVSLIFDSWSDFMDSLRRVQAYATAHPDSLIVPCHCEETQTKIQALLTA